MAEKEDYSKQVIRVDDDGEVITPVEGADDGESAVAVEQESSFTEVVKRLFGGDRVLWVIIIALMTISVLVVYSSTAKMAYMPSSSSSPAEFLRTQLIYLVGGAVLLFGVHRINSRVYRYFAPLVWFVSVVMTFAVYFTDRTTNGAARWFPIFGFQFQPSEMLKVAVILFLAHQLAKRQKTIGTQRIIPTLKIWKWNTPEERAVWRDGGKALFVPIVLSCMAILPAHTSSAVIVFLVSVAMLIIGRVKWTEIWRLIKWAIMGVSMVFMLGIGRGDTAGGRISTWIELWTTSRMEVAAEDLTDTERAMIAIHNGGILGRGAGHSTVRVEMTHPESDYAFAFFVEEYGIGLAMILVALYVWVFFRAIEIFEKCPKRFPAMLALGLALLITGQALAHIMVTVNIFPETGQTLPLISRGGSSLIFTCIALGMILSVSRQTEEGSHAEEN
ncbi:MAG: FtsW/RodA/SpoVE family cell cycle protein [Alistipes sp.]|nr:FtsW/RodA/SpoVE family cell cycle protein [Alistipes sp.]